MRIVSSTYKKPANLLIAAMQKYCIELLLQPQQYDINNLKDLENKLWRFAIEQQQNFKKCDLTKLDVVSNSNLIHEFYHLLHGERSMIMIFARPDAAEKAFRDYDDQRRSSLSH